MSPFSNCMDACHESNYDYMYVRKIRYIKSLLRTQARLVQPRFEIRHEFSLVVVRLLRWIQSVGPLVRRVRCCPPVRWKGGWSICVN